ncbi:four-carbon acid sugar kinase family protein [Moorella naiadis]|uniref:four-carbon acid sugar kinase family protein n=1 Tax=Moorella naiadis (nom. illeg.) TaxID=3093670 RepID=UPI003D9CB1BF
MAQTLVIADDLTGANDTAVAFAQGHARCLTVFGREELSALPTAEVVALDTETRNLPTTVATRQVTEIVKPFLPVPPSVLLFKKIDSTLRGNVGAEVDVILARSGLPLAVVAPAFPDNSRVVIGGCVLVNGRPLERTHIGQDVFAPVRSFCVCQYKNDPLWQSKSDPLMIK